MKAWMMENTENKTNQNPISELFRKALSVVRLIEIIIGYMVCGQLTRRL